MNDPHNSAPPADPSDLRVSKAGLTATIGEAWGYRARGREPLVPVEVRRIGTKRPPRVLVRFLDDRLEGREDWVPPGRLKVRWEHAEDWAAAERQWWAVEDVSAVAVRSAEHRAAQMVLRTLPPFDAIDDRAVHKAAVLVVLDPTAFAERVGIDADRFAVEPGYRRRDGAIVAPWPALLTVVRRLAQLGAETLLPDVSREDAEAQRAAIFGEWQGGEYISPEIYMRVDADYAPAREVVRQWCGAAARERHDELLALRDEVRRLGGLAEAAISALRSAGATAQADKLERELGIPVEVLRQAQDDQRDSGPYGLHP